MIEKIDSKLELDKTEEDNLGKDNNVTTVETVSISEQKVVMKVETDEDVEVNIIGNSGLKGVEDNCVDVIEIDSSSSSSFDGTGSDTELSDSDDEVETRKRDEWRKYVRYVLKCFKNWTELGNGMFVCWFDLGCRVIRLNRD
ncbi:hypothetical protein TSUD_401750 [Trifolium subterraneum]|uniref:Uncharacterized protein n=1 Tax=Trifolium subterraneum TaxID=3900 RepID=A0A2Z6NVE3_TRISU|nr:hypothetical protein TSUD_401750 [Trifolium subterraneum]